MLEVEFLSDKSPGLKQGLTQGLVLQGLHSSGRGYQTRAEKWNRERGGGTLSRGPCGFLWAKEGKAEFGHILGYKLNVDRLGSNPDSVKTLLIT